MRLLNVLRRKPFCNNLHFFIIPLILISLIRISWIFIIPLLLYFFFIYKKTKLLIPIAILSLLFIIPLLIIPRLTLAPKDTYTAYVYKIDENKVYSLIDGKRVICYDSKISYSEGDVLEFKLTKRDDAVKSYDADFDYRLYLLGKGIVGEYNVNKSTKKYSLVSIYQIRTILISYYKNNLSNDSFLYVKSIVLGENDLDTNLRNAYSALGLSHILAISGMHIFMLYGLISFFVKKLFRIYSKRIPLIIIVLYVIVIGFPTSAIRAVLFLLLSNLNDKGEVKYTKLDILSISFILMTIANPYQIYQTGFILSYLVSFFLIFINEIIKDKGLIYKYKSYALLYLVTLPIVCNITNRINLISLLLSPILTPIVTYILIPISFMLAVIPPLDFLLKYIYMGLNFSLISFNSVNISIPIRSFNIYWAIIYYLILAIAIIRKIKTEKTPIKEYLVLFIYLVIFISCDLANPISTVTFIDVGQGDSAIIRLSHNRGVIVIDSYNSYDYLKSTGIYTIDYLILTHSDNDHIKDAEKIVEDFNVRNILLSKYDNEYGLDGIRVSAGNKFLLSNTEINILGPINKYDEKNSNSIVVKITIDSLSYLFCGDMTIEEENDLALKYKNYLNSDVIKVGHHGSDTSTSDELINYVRPSYSIISVAKNNKYGLPSKTVCDKLENKSIVYYTKNSGNITFLSWNDYFWVSTYR